MTLFVVHMSHAQWTDGVPAGGITLNIGETKAFTIGYGGGLTHSWSYPLTGVYSVECSSSSKTAYITGLKKGDSYIRIRYWQGSSLYHEQTCDIHVTEPDPVSISLNSTSVSLEIGGTKQLTATVSPEGASQSVTWLVDSGSSVASVSESGLITAKAAGTATIRATSSVKSSVYKDCTVTVTKPDPVSISLNCTAASMELGETRQLKATVLPSGASQDVTWSVYSGSSVVSVDESGLVTANAVGVAKIRATSSVKSSVYKDCTVTVTKPAPASISLSDTNVSLETGETTQLVASILPNEASQSVTWSSNNPYVATVDDDGKVTAASSGETVITASATEDSNIKASCTIIVVDAGDTDISQLDNIIYLEPTEVNAGTTMTLFFRMKNSAAIHAFQFDLYLPEGMTAAKNSKGKIIAALNNGRLPLDDEHTLSLQEQADGSIHFLCNSLYEETFTGNEGEILTLTVIIADDVVTSEYPVVMKDIRLTEIDTSKYYEHSYIKTTLRGPGCATPTIIYAGGKLKFSCETEGVEFVSTITDDDIKSYRKDEVELSATYTISVYATKPGYTDSDVVTGTLCWIEQQPTTENIVDEDAVTKVKALPVLIQTQGSTINVQGLDAGTEVYVYSIDGKQQGSAVSVNGAAQINTSLQPGSVAVVKIGEKTVKVMVK